MDHVAGFCVVHDVSERAFQLEGTGQWVKGKSADTFGPIGPWLVTPDEVPDYHKLDMWLEVDGKRYQNGTTETMVFGVPYLVSYLSKFMSLHAGDIISTGTPPGVGHGMKPPVYLRAGNVVRLGVARLGEQRQRVVAAADESMSTPKPKFQLQGTPNAQLPDLSVGLWDWECLGIWSLTAPRMPLTADTVDALAAIVGRDGVLTQAEDLIPYSFDGTAALKQRPEAVVFPRSAGAGGRVRAAGGLGGRADRDARLRHGAERRQRARARAASCSAWRR